MTVSRSTAWLILPCGILLAACAAAPVADPLRFERAIALPGVAGRIDHLACRGDRLFVAALGNGTLECVDLRSDTIVRATGLHEPQGMAVLPDGDRAVVACGGDGMLRAFTVDALTPGHAIAAGGDADNVRIDAAGGRLFVGAEGQLTVFALADLAPRGAFVLRGHAESFQLDAVRGRIYVNVPDQHEIAVLDLATGKSVASWPLSAAANYPMALDAAAGRLYVGCRQPAKLLVFDVQAGREVAAVDCTGDVDDLFVDVARQRLYAIGGEGAVDVFALDGGAPHRLARVPTAAGARTGLWVEARSELFVAVPQRPGQRCELRVFAAR